jgi:hypothetical protein
LNELHDSLISILIFSVSGCQNANVRSDTIITNANYLHSKESWNEGAIGVTKQQHKYKGNSNFKKANSWTTQNPTKTGSVREGLGYSVALKKKYQEVLNNFQKFGTAPMLGVSHHWKH